MAEVPELPGYMAHGHSQNVALATADEAIRLWLDADHPPRSGARLSRHHGAAHEGGHGPHRPPRSAPGHASAGSSVVPTPAASTRTTHGGGQHINRTFLRWEEADISKVG